MSELWADAGAALLAAATLAQAARLARTRSARDFGWPFVALNLVGLLLLSLRSGELGETAFLTINMVGAGFWILVFAIKMMEAGNPPRAAPFMPPRADDAGA